MYIWSGNKCRDYWVRTYRSSRRLRGQVTGKNSFWGDREHTIKVVVYRRTAIHGLTQEQASAIIKRGGDYFSYLSYHTKERKDGLVDLFHICPVRQRRTDIIMRT
jgi:hypothetical protein